MRIIYADSLLLLNFIIDYLLLLATGKICTLPLRRLRLVLGALWGAVYALLCVTFPDLFSLATVKIFSGLAVAAIAFGGLGPYPRTALVFFAVSAAFGGAVYAAASLAGIHPGQGPVLSIPLRSLVLSFALCYAALSLVFRGMDRRCLREVRTVEVVLRGRKANFRALRDTGNELRSSRGSPVMVAEWGAVAELFPELSVSQDPDPPALLLAISSLPAMEGRCRLFPCLTATNPSGLLPAFRPDELLIEGEKAPHSHLAIIPGPLSSDGNYRALF